MLRNVLRWAGVLIGVLVAWIAVLYLANAVVKERVPVSLSSSHLVTAFGEGYAAATGTWVIEGERQAFPLQTTQIRCEKQLGRCTSGTATVMLGDQLNVDVSFHDVVSWEKDRIVFTDDSPRCVDYVYTMDLVTKVVNGVRRKKQSTEAAGEDCATFSKELRVSLKGGFDEVRALEKAAMPWFGELALAPLKLFR